MKDLKDVMALMRQQHSRLDGLRMGANWRGNTIQRPYKMLKLTLLILWMKTQM
jgi:hypothetical protein